MTCLSFLAGGGGGSCCDDWGVAGLETVRGEGKGAGEAAAALLLLVVVVVVFLEGVVGGRGEEGAGEGEAPRSDRPKTLDEALLSEAAGELGLELELDWSSSERRRPWLELEALDLVRPEPNTLRRWEAMMAQKRGH